MIIYPAIDLRHGQCVRLYQGDFARETIYELDPFLTIKKFVDEGAKWLHIVDLDAAKHPEHNQASLIDELINYSGINVQTGGGIRTSLQIKNLLKQNAARVIIGSMSVSDPKLVYQWLKEFGSERLVLALDVFINTKQQPMVAINGWQTISDCCLFDLVAYYLQAGLKHILCTNISLDGTLNGPDISLYTMLQLRYPSLAIMASGGIHTLSDIKQLNENNIHGAIIGRALYENKLSLREVLSC